jgi:hypothetical protein
MANVRVLKLITGEEIAAIVGPVGGLTQQADSSKILLEKPVMLAMVPTQEGDLRPTIMPWAQHVEGNKVSIDLNKIIYNEPANEGLVAAYQNATGSIATPPRELALPNRRR